MNLRPLSWPLNPESDAQMKQHNTKYINVAGRLISAVMSRSAVTQESREIEPQQTRAALVPGSLDTEKRTVIFCASTGERGMRRPYFGEDYYEELEISEKAIRLDRFNNGGPFLKDHAVYSIDNQIGVIERAYIENGELLILVRFAKDEASEEIYQKVVDGVLRSVSVSYRVYTYERSSTEGELDVLRATDWEPLEASLVTVGFDSKAQARAQEQHPNTCKVINPNNRAAEPGSKEETAMLLEQRAAKLGLTRREGETDEALLGRIIDAERNQAAESARSGADDAARNEGAAAERTRSAGIYEACRKAGVSQENATKWVGEGLEVSDVHARIIDELHDTSKRANNQTHGNHYIDESPNRERLVEIRSGFADAVMERTAPGHKSGKAAELFRGMTLLECARELLRQGGAETRGLNRMDIATRAMSTSDLPSVLADVSNKTLLRSYTEVPRTFEVLGRRTTINDFKAVDRDRLGSFSDLKPKGENGEFEYGVVSDSKESYALATYGKKIKFSREMLINDDLDALLRIVQLFGSAAARKESELVWGHLLSSPVMSDGVALYHANHKNLGSAAAISTASISAGRQRMRKQTDGNGTLIEVAPAYLVCGPDKETEAEQFLSGTLRPSKTVDVVPERMRNSLDLVVENRITGNQWFLFSSPNLIDTFEYAYLAGQEGVYIDSDPQFLSGDITWGVRHDFAAKAIDWRGMDKNPGA